MIKAGTWVEIERVLLRPEERAAGLPGETASKPYMLRLSGFLLEDAELGQQVGVRSLIGHEHQGVLRAVNPSYHHDFGDTVPELLTINGERA